MSSLKELTINYHLAKKEQLQEMNSVGSDLRTEAVRRTVNHKPKPVSLGRPSEAKNVRSLTQ